MCWTALCHYNVPRHTTHCDTVWIQKLTVVFATRSEVELEDSVSVKHLSVNNANTHLLNIYSTPST